MNRMQATYTMVVATVIIILVAMAWKGDSSDLVEIINQHGQYTGTVDCSRDYGMQDGTLTLTVIESVNDQLIEHTIDIIISDVCK